jgi:hypothetical protein
MSLLVILGVREGMDPKAWAEWGWRIPFLVSILLLAISVWIRLSLNESPAFQKMKSEGKTSKAPLTESFGQWRNLKVVILALLGLTAGQAVVWYTGQFYALFFMTTIAKVDVTTANLLIAASLIIGTPFLHRVRRAVGQDRPQADHHGGLPDRRAHLLHGVPDAAEGGQPGLVAAQQATKVTITADPKQCSFQGSPIAREIDFTSSCDVAKRALTQAYIPYENVAGPGRHARHHQPSAAR